jgi:hypothetical protein
MRSVVFHLLHPDRRAGEGYTEKLTRHFYNFWLLMPLRRIKTSMWETEFRTRLPAVETEPNYISVFCTNKQSFLRCLEKPVYQDFSILNFSNRRTSPYHINNQQSAKMCPSCWSSFAAIVKLPLLKIGSSCWLCANITAGQSNHPTFSPT